MFEAHPYAPFFLGLLAVIFVAVIGYMVMYNRRQKAFLKDVEREGHHSHSVDEGILLAQERAHQKHMHGAHKTEPDAKK